MSCTQKVFLITGASSGIGAGIAEHLSVKGNQLALIGRNCENLKSTADKCVPVQGAKAPLEIVADITVEADAKRAIEETIKYFGKLDVLVNNAGILINGTIETTTLEQFDSVINLNLRAAFHLTQLAIPHLFKSKGNIVNVSSANGIRAFPGVLAYNLSKAALNQLTQCTALELADKGIRVNCVLPGLFLTNIHRRTGMDENTYEAFTERIIAGSNIRRAGEMHEIADAVEFLASERASFITGELLAVDGGRNLICPR